MGEIKLTSKADYTARVQNYLDLNFVKDTRDRLPFFEKFYEVMIDFIKNPPVRKEGLEKEYNCGGTVFGSILRNDFDAKKSDIDFALSLYWRKSQ